MNGRAPFGVLLHPPCDPLSDLAVDANISNVDKIWEWVHAWVSPLTMMSITSPIGFTCKGKKQCVGVVRVSLPPATGARPNRVSTVAGGGYLPVPAQ